MSEEQLQYDPLKIDNSYCPTRSQDKRLSIAPRLPEKENVLIRAIRLFFDKFGSRKLLAFIVSTLLFSQGLLTEPHFMYVLLAYIGVQTGLDFFDKVKGLKNGKD